MKVPEEILAQFEHEIEDISYGEASLTVHIRDGKQRYAISRELSLYPPADARTRVKEFNSPISKRVLQSPSPHRNNNSDSSYLA